MDGTSAERDVSLASGIRGALASVATTMSSSIQFALDHGERQLIAGSRPPVRKCRVRFSAVKDMVPNSTIRPWPLMRVPSTVPV